MNINNASKANVVANLNFKEPNGLEIGTWIKDLVYGDRDKETKNILRSLLY